MRVVILGGGSAGWMTAAMLLQDHNSLAPVLQLTLVESPGIGRIGVGEATTPVIKRGLEMAGIDEQTFLKAAEATFKHGIRFKGWSAPGEDYFHPFEAFGEQGNDLPLAEQWLARSQRGEARPFAYEAGVQVTLADARRAPKPVGGRGFGGPLPYAYHLDADLLADLLRDKAVAAGAWHLQDDVVEVLRSGESGDITALRTAGNGLIEGDFFIDCSGFASLLLQRTLEVPFIPFSDHLLCDRAVAVRLPHPDSGELEPATVCTAQDSGWMWKIALQRRTGQGYVYSSHFTSDDEAERRLREVTGAPADMAVRKLRMRTGRAARSWERNCVAVGLSGGFIEPLESTGLHLIVDSIRVLSRLLPLRGVEPGAREIFNRYLAEEYDEIRDFIVLHYCLSARAGPFWDAVRQPEHIPERLQALLAHWRRRTPADEDLASRHIFAARNYQYVMYGMNWAPPESAAFAQRRRYQQVGQSMETRRAQLLATLPGHRAYLQAAIGLS